jgi:membrane fusion protein (multidrug efflux system)
MNSPFFSLLPLLAAITLVAGCGETEVNAVNHDAAMGTDRQISISQTRVERLDLMEPILTTGTIRADQTTNISPIVSGLVEDVFVKVGDRVTKNQPLFQLRQTDIQLRVRQLEHALTLAKAEYRNVEKDLKTNQGLRKRGAVSQEVLDNTLTRHEITGAQLGIAESQLAQAQQSLADTTGKAPFDGVITQREINEGSYIRNMPGARSTALQIQKIDTVEAVVTVPDIYLNRIRLGSPTRVFVDGLSKSYDSQIDIINDRVDQQSRTLEIRIRISNDAYEIKPGLFARVEIFPEERSALVLPRQAIRGSSSPYVFVNDQGFAKKVSVSTRGLDAERVEVYAGLEAGTGVLVGKNLAQITPGAAIQVTRSGN